MALSLDSVIRYIPEFGGERAKSESNENERPAVFHIRVMGAVAFRAFAAKLARLNENEGDFGESVTSLYREAVSLHVQRIENLRVDGKAILDGASFYDHPAMPNELVMEIERAVVEANRLSETNRKN